MEKNPYNLFCIFFISISILTIFIIFKKFIKDKKNIYRILLWSLIVSYTAMLPYTILALNLGSKYLSGMVIKKIPIFMALILVLACFFISRNYKDFIRKYNVFATITGIIIYTVILALQKLPNKQIHVSQYFLLSFLIFCAARLDYKGRGIYVYVWYFASLMGILDEFFQGIHNARFFSMSDILSDSASSLGAVLFISCTKLHLSINSSAITKKTRKISLFREFYFYIFSNQYLRYYTVTILILGIATFFNFHFLKLYSLGERLYISPVIMSIFISVSILAIFFRVIVQYVKKIFSREQFLFIFLAPAVFFLIQLSTLAVIILEIQFI